VASIVQPEYAAPCVPPGHDVLVIVKVPREPPLELLLDVELPLEEELLLCPPLEDEEPLLDEELLPLLPLLLEDDDAPLLELLDDVELVEPELDAVLPSVPPPPPPQATNVKHVIEAVRNSEVARMQGVSDRTATQQCL
jgi:hypothetical protein